MLPDAGARACGGRGVTAPAASNDAAMECEESMPDEARERRLTVQSVRIQEMLGDLEVLLVRGGSDAGARWDRA